MCGNHVIRSKVVEKKIHKCDSRSKNELKSSLLDELMKKIIKREVGISLTKKLGPTKSIY